MNELTEEKLKDLERRLETLFGPLAEFFPELLSLISAARERQELSTVIQDLREMVFKGILPRSVLDVTDKDFVWYFNGGTPKELHPPASGKSTSKD